MSRSPARPTFRRMLVHDFPAIFSLGLIFAAWVTVAMWPFLMVADPPPGMEPTTAEVTRVSLIVASIALAVTVVLGALVAWRVRRIRSVFEIGSEVEGTITKVEFSRKGSGRIEYEFELGGQAYSGGEWTRENADTESLKVGDRLAILVDERQPERSYIRLLYCGRA